MNAPKVGGPKADECLTQAIERAEQAGKEIAADFHGRPKRERRKIVTAFRRQLFPPGKPGRRLSNEITAACADWDAGLRGAALYQKHIPRFDRMSHWQRKVRTRALLDAIRSRKRRERNAI